MAKSRASGAARTVDVGSGITVKKSTLSLAREAQQLDEQARIRAGWSASSAEQMDANTRASIRRVMADNNYSEKATEKVFQQRIKDMTERIKNAPEARYVNGYGEATTREITSSTYKRAQKRQEKQIANMFRNR